ncbi:MAG: WG repeat-containing protein [Candidatus Obscuribacter sp.]|nr:WG repeat-containing protein [Candidatus Obscuribacter sp.]MBP6594303.1 WG repeat-containing protein [Candidatus Obscuribacter sp.]MBP7575716.1 WG repeat-containing protein [Candidatus Obscuribacter sp.]
MEQSAITFLANASAPMALVALYLCLPLSGIKLKPFGVIFAIIFSFFSALIAMLSLFIGGMSLYVAFWAALGGGQGVLAFIAVIETAVAIGAVAANYWTIALSASLMPDVLTITSKKALLCTSVLIVATQAASVYMLQTFGPIGVGKARPLFGFIDKSGKFIIKPSYGDVEKFHNGLAVVWPEAAYPEIVGDVEALKSYSQIDKNGKVAKTINESQHRAIKNNYLYTNPEDAYECKSGNNSFSLLGRESNWQYGKGTGSDIASKYFEGLAVKQSKNYRYGYVDSQGKTIIAPSYIEALRFTEGLAAVQKNDKWGYIDRSGKYVIKPQFDKASPFSEGLACVGIYNDTNDPKYSTAPIGLARFGYIDKTGKFVIPPVLMHAYSFSEGLAGACIDVNNPPDLKYTPQNQKELEEKMRAASESALKDRSLRCVKAWRDSGTWGETAENGPEWLAEVEQLLKVEPGKDDFYAYRAAIYTGLYPVKFKEAKASALEALAINNKNALAHGVLAHCLTVNKDNKGAIEHFSKAIDYQPQNPEWYANRGLTYEDTGENKKAILDYTSMLDNSLDKAWAYGSRAHARLSIEDRAGAIQDSDNAIEQDITSVFAYKQKADALSRQGKFVLALAELAKAEAYINPNSWEMLELLQMRQSMLGFKGDKAKANAVQKQIQQLKKQLVAN